MQVKELRSDSSQLKNFVVTVSLHKRDELYKPRFWPQIIRIKIFNFLNLNYTLKVQIGRWYFIEKPIPSIVANEVSSKSSTKSINYSIIQQNVQPLGNSFDKLENLLKYNSETIILRVTEHWKSIEQINQIGLRNFKLVTNICWDERKHGSGTVYVSNKFHVKECKNIWNMSIIGEFECNTVELVLNMEGIVSVYYPPSGQTELFREYFGREN